MESFAGRAETCHVSSPLSLTLVGRKRGGMISDVTSQTHRPDITNLTSQECIEEGEPREKDFFVCLP